MADSIREQIVLGLVAAIRGVTAAAGYEVEIRTVDRVRRTGYQGHEYPAVNVMEGPELKQAGPASLTSCFLTVSLEISVWEQTNLASAANKAMAAVMKAVLADRTLGGLAIDLDETGNKMFLDETDPTRPIGGFRVELSIEYRHAENDPYRPI